MQKIDIIYGFKTKELRVQQINFEANNYICCRSGDNILRQCTKD